jgi:NAD-dependent deacetylase
MSGKRIVVFTGAGVSAESNVATFRDTNDGLWYNYKIEEVATTEAWKNDKEKVLEFHNMLRKMLPDAEPNQAHLDIVELEEFFDVTVITQNVDDLHERAGSKNILHLHGELTKARSSYYIPQVAHKAKLYDIGYGEINVGDKDDEHGSQLRPHTVLFGEYPFNMEDAYEALMNADYVIIVGCSFQIGYTIDMINNVSVDAEVFYIDPQPVSYFDVHRPISKIENVATKGMRTVKELLYTRNGIKF